MSGGWTVITYEVLAKVERVEVLVGEIYDVIQGRLTAHAEAHALFARLSDEERQHARRVSLLAAQYRHDRRAFPGGLGGVEELEQVTALCMSVLDELHADEGPTTFGASVSLALELEHRLTRMHADHLAVGAGPELADFFRRLALQDQAHVQLLSGWAARASRVNGHH